MTRPVSSRIITLKLVVCWSVNQSPRARQECKVKWALGSITVNKPSGGDGIPVELFQILNDDAVKVLNSICQQTWETQHGHRTGKGQFSFQTQRKAMPKNVQLLHNCTHLYAGQETTVRIGHGTTDWFQIGKGVHQGYILSPYLIDLYAEYIMWNAGLDEAQAVIKFARRISITSDMQMTPPLWQKLKN